MSPRASACVLLTFLVTGTALATGKDVNVMDIYYCVDQVFSRTTPPVPPIARGQGLTQEGVREVGSRLQGPLLEAINSASSAALKDYPPGRKAVPEKYYLQFIDQLARQLPHFYPISSCDQSGLPPELLPSALFDVSINRHFEQLVGHGRLDQWFALNGGSYEEPTFLAAMISLELAGRPVDIGTWQRYYVAYVKRKYGSGSNNSFKPKPLRGSA
jgi:hypothetical protein